jgi:hypothetical protein
MQSQRSNPRRKADCSREKCNWVRRKRGLRAEESCCGSNEKLLRKVMQIGGDHYSRSSEAQSATGKSTRKRERKGKRNLKCGLTPCQHPPKPQRHSSLSQSGLIGMREFATWNVSSPGREILLSSRMRYSQNIDQAQNLLDCLLRLLLRQPMSCSFDVPCSPEFCTNLVHILYSSRLLK